VVFLNAISLAQPTGLWQTVLFWLQGLVSNYAVAIIILTVFVRLCLVPFDFMNKYFSKKNARIQKQMKPELEKINAKYAGQRDIINQKTAELYRRHNFNVSGLCFTMILPMLLSIIVFTTVFSAVGTISRYESANQFLEVRQAYFAEYDIDVDSLLESETAMNRLAVVLDGKSDDEKATLLANAQASALAKYEETKDSFLWIDNIWLPDAAWTNPIMPYKTFIDNSDISTDDITEDEYNLVLESADAETRNSNGFFILVVLAVVTSYLSTAVNGWVTKASAKKKGLNMNQVSLGNTGKILMWILPVVIGLIILFYNAAFAIYSTMGSIVLLITNPIMTLFIDMLEFEAIEKEEDRTMAAYDRKRK